MQPKKTDKPEWIKSIPEIIPNRRVIEGIRRIEELRLSAMYGVKIKLRKRKYHAA